MLKKIIMAFIGTLVKILSGGLATLTLYVDEPVEKKNLNLVKWAIANGHLNIDTRVVTITSAVVEEYNSSEDTSLVGMISLLKARTADQQERAISVRFEIPSGTPSDDSDSHTNPEVETSDESEKDSSWDDIYDNDDSNDWGDDFDNEDSSNDEEPENDDSDGENNEEESNSDDSVSDEKEVDNEESDSSDDSDEEEFGSDDEGEQEENTVKKTNKIVFGKKVSKVSKINTSNKEDTPIPEMSQRVHDAIASMVEWTLRSESEFVGVFPIGVFNAKDRIMEMAELRKTMKDNGVTQFNVRTDLPQIHDQMIPYNSHCWYFPTSILSEVAQNYGGVLRYTLKDSTYTAFIVYNGEVYAPGKGWNYEKPLENVKKLDRVYGKEPFAGLDYMLRQKKLICRTKCNEILELD